PRQDRHGRYRQDDRPGDDLRQPHDRTRRAADPPGGRGGAEGIAAPRLRAPADKLAVKDGVVSVAGSPSKRVTYAQLVGGKRFYKTIQAEGKLGEMKLAQDVKPKDPKEYEIVGKSIERVDVPPKTTGEAVYVHDVRIPGMLHGRVVRPPVVNSAPSSIDESSIKDISG